MRKILEQHGIAPTALKVSIQLPPLSVNNDPSRLNLTKIRHIIGISSCKGGVGKSTVAVNIACTLAMSGLKIGILDADVYGPSLPFQLEATEKVVRPSKTRMGHILPLNAKNIKNLSMLSFGHVNPKSGAPGSVSKWRKLTNVLKYLNLSMQGGSTAALMRGPIATKVINQMLLCTEWGDLDYLVRFKL